MLLLGLDLGSSSIKASIFNSERGINLLSDYFPKKEMVIHTPDTGWAKQDPDEWFQHVETILLMLRKKFKGSLADIKAIGLSYQMYGLVAVDKQGKPVRHSIIWCDSRAVSFGNVAFHAIRESFCLDNLFKSPRNFTASNLNG